VLSQASSRRPARWGSPLDGHASGGYPQGVRRVLPALVNQFISLVKDSSLVYFLGLLAAQRDLFRIGQDQAANTGNESALLLAGLFYLVITVPLTHAVNYIDSRLRTGRRGHANDGADTGEDALVLAAHTQEEP